MRIKRYLAQDMSEAMGLIKADLGPEAVIISSRKVRSKGFFGFFRPRRLEVTAALDEKGTVPPGKGTVPPGPKGDSPPWPEPVAAAAPAVTGGGRPPVEAIGVRGLHAVPLPELHRELTEIKDMLARFAPDAKEGYPGVPGGTSLSGSAGRRVEDDAEAFYGEWQRLLEEVEILPDVAAHLITELRRQVDPLAIQRNDLARICLQNEIVRLVEPAYAQAAQKRVMAFVGPTGVGKTTTLAKMAAQYTLFHGKSCAIITIDTYRIGAVEQLNIYAEIMGVPLEIAMSPQDFAKAVQRHRNKEFIFVDTAGRPTRNSEKVAELHSYFAALEDPADVILVLSSNTKHRDLLRAVRHFGKMNYSKLIFTKVDETDTLGCIFNMICHTGLPVVQITDGQNVPDDIQNMYPKKLAKLLTKGVELGA
ncbi:MAG: flagellar biosynthesis protein FlhF [Bacillota bacterium]|jgi:flagellar biosynthesis protein FlhF